MRFDLRRFINWIDMHLDILWALSSFQCCTPQLVQRWSTYPLEDGDFHTVYFEMLIRLKALLEAEPEP